MGPLLIVVLSLIYSNQMIAADVTWTNGNSTGLWSDPLNWSNTSIPGTGDNVIFDNTSTANCQIALSVDVKELLIDNGYSGTITQGILASVTIGTGGFEMLDGTFVGGDSYIDVAADFQLKGGAFTSTSDTLFLQDDFKHSGGTFTHNSGTVTFNKGGKQNFDVVSPAPMFYNVVIDLANNKPLIIKGGDTLLVENQLTLNNGKIDNSVVAVERTVLINSGWDDGNSTLLFVGSDTSRLQLNYGSWDGNDVYIMKDDPANIVWVEDADGDGDIILGNTGKDLGIVTGQLAFEDNIIADLNYKNLEIESDGTLIGSSNEIIFQGNYLSTGGTYTHNSGLFTFDGQGKRDFEASTAQYFFDLNIEMQNGKELQSDALDTIYTEGTLSLINGKANDPIFFAAGDVDVSATYDAGLSPLIFTGSANQNFNLSGDPGNYDGDITLAKTTSGNVTLTSAFTMDEFEQMLHLNNGNLVTTSANILTMADNTLYTGGSNTSFIDGPMIKIGDDAFSFPVGKASTIAPIAIGAPANIGDGFRAEYINTDPAPIYGDTAFSSSMNHISSCEYWLLERSSGTADVTVSISFEDPRTCGVANPSELRIAGWNGTMWNDLGNGGTTGTASSGTARTLNLVNTFGPITLGSTTIYNPLPIELLEFKAVVGSSYGILSWTTAVEIDNDYFLVEKLNSEDYWSTLTKVTGEKASTEVKHYSVYDYDLIPGENYYRLKQVDLDGTFDYSEIVSLRFIQSEPAKVKLYPNPTNNYVSIIATESQLSTLSLFNFTGKEFPIHIVDSGTGYRMISLQDCPPGYYFLSGNNHVQQIIKY